MNKFSNFKVHRRIYSHCQFKLFHNLEWKVSRPKFRSGPTTVFAELWSVGDVLRRQQQSLEHKGLKRQLDMNQRKTY